MIRVFEHLNPSQLRRSMAASNDIEGNVTKIVNDYMHKFIFPERGVREINAYLEQYLDRARYFNDIHSYKIYYRVLNRTGAQFSLFIWIKYYTSYHMYPRGDKEFKITYKKVL